MSIFSFLKPVDKKNRVIISVVDYGGHYRVEFNFGGYLYTSVNKVQVAPDAPSKLFGYEGWTAEDAYQHRQIHHRPKPGSGFGWINLRETETITSLELAEKAITSVLAEKEAAGIVWTDVQRKDMSLVDYITARKRGKL